MLMPDSGSEFSIPDPGSKISRIRICIKQFQPEKLLLLSSWKNDLGCSYRIRIFFHPGSRIQRSIKHRTLDPDPLHCFYLEFFHERYSLNLKNIFFRFPQFDLFLRLRYPVHACFFLSLVCNLSKWTSIPSVKSFDFITFKRIFYYRYSIAAASCRW
jgi:hypothetical protein